MRIVIALRSRFGFFKSNRKEEGGGWTGLRFSEDGRRLVMIEFLSVNQSHLWIVDVATGRKRRVSRPGSGDAGPRPGVPFFMRGARAGTLETCPRQRH